MSYSDWSVYYIYNCRDTTPPKNKFSVIFNFNDGLFDFLINSEISSFVKNRKYLLPCISDIQAASNDFLEYDSFIDCREIFDFSIDELVHHKGEVSDETQQNIIKAVTACPVLELKFKNPLLSRYGGLIGY